MSSGQVMSSHFHPRVLWRPGNLHSVQGKDKCGSANDVKGKGKGGSSDSGKVKKRGADNHAMSESRHCGPGRRDYARLVGVPECTIEQVK